MKPIATFLVLTCMSLSSIRAQEPPPAFQRTSTPEAPETDVAETTPVDPREPDLFEYDPVAPKLVRVQVEFVEIPHTELTRLMQADSSKTTDSSTLRRQAQALVEKGQGKVLETQIIIARSGERATAESIQEVVYPTEYKRPSVETTDKDGQKTNSQILPGTPLPEAMETRNAGSIIEIEPVVGENDTLVSIRLSPELVIYTGTTSWHETKDANGTINKIQTPDFFIWRLNTACTLVNGQTLMVGVLSPKGEGKAINPDRKVMVFVKADVLCAMP